MTGQAYRRGAFALMLLLAACKGQPDTMASTVGDETHGDPCEQPAFEYRDVCFAAYSVEAVGYDHPLELDGQPGHELVGVGDEHVTIYRYDGDDFVLLGEAEAPPAMDLMPDDVIAGELDEEPGLDLVVSERGEWAALYHLDEDGAPTLAGETMFGASSGRAFEAPVAVGPDANGRWRIVARYIEEGSELLDPLALWEVQGSSFVQVERLATESGACEIQNCAGGEFNGDGLADAVCTLDDVCPSDQPGNSLVNVVLLAQPDGTVTTLEFPMATGADIVTDLDGDGITDLVGTGVMDTLWYLLGDRVDGLAPAVSLNLPTPPSLGWSLSSVGDLDGDGNVEVVLGDALHALVFDDLVGAPQDYEMLEVDGLEFQASGIEVPIDVNADGIVDLPMRGRTLLVSQVQ
jgi:hypothetical protein